MSYPKPDGYRGGDDSAAGFVGITTGGHRGINLESDPEMTVDAEFRRNCRQIQDMFSDSMKEDTGW